MNRLKVFDDNQIDTGRIISCVAGVLPLGAISFFGYRKSWNSDKILVGNPPRIVFSIVWGMLTILWLIATLIASFRFTDDGVICFQVVSMTLLVSMLWWLHKYDAGDMEKSFLPLVLSTVLSFLFLVVGVAAPDDYGNSWVHLSIGMCLAPLTAWMAIATCLQLVHMNLK